MDIQKSKEYKELIFGIKVQIKNSRQKALLSVNKELLILYWNIGNIILDFQNRDGWGSKVIDNISEEIKRDFPDLKGFSSRNLKYMRKFALEYKDLEFVQQVVAQIPWSHNVVLMDRISDIEQRTWYIYKTKENEWSRNTLIHQIENNLFERQNKNMKTSNFMDKLDAPNNKLAVETLKDPYIFDFISMTEEMN